MQEAQAGYVQARQPSNMHEQSILQERDRERERGDSERWGDRERWGEREILASLVRPHANFMGTQKKATHKKCEIHFLSSSHRQSRTRTRPEPGWLAGWEGAASTTTTTTSATSTPAVGVAHTYTNTTHASLAEQLL